MIARAEHLAGRCLLAILFAAGALQKALDPAPAQDLLIDAGLPAALAAWLVLPAMAFNAGAAVMLVANVRLRPLARALALYCLATSYFHFIPSDPWQMSILIKNWAIAGGCLILSAEEAGRRPTSSLRERRAPLGGLHRAARRPPNDPR